jgi:hypothetical protein
MLFCPCCGNLLLIQHHTQGEQSFICQTCPYVFPIGSKEVNNHNKILMVLLIMKFFILRILCSFFFQYKNRTTLKRKEVDDVLGGEEGWKNVDSTEGKVFFKYISSPLKVFLI